MRAALSLVTFAVSALAANIPLRGERERALVPKGYKHGGCDECETVTTKVIVTYTTVCPVTETTTQSGTTCTSTYTTTSTVETAVPTTIVVTKTAPPVTKTAGEGKQRLHPLFIMPQG
jgi:hypothetical protein